MSTGSSVEDETRYLKKRLRQAKLQSIPFYLCRVFRIEPRKIVFCTIEGTTGYMCNPKYIAEEMIRLNQELPDNQRWKLVWLVNDTTKSFPREIKVKKNTLWNRAYELSTAKFWIDNSRKQLEVRKRKGQIYIQTWHAKLGFKPTCLDRGASFTKIAYAVSKHDSDMVDYWLSNSDWYNETLPTGSLYEGKTLRTGSPRCDILVNRTEADRLRVRKTFGLNPDDRILMYAPTFRGGSQTTDRRIQKEQERINYSELIQALKQRFGGSWKIFLRLHPQLTARNIEGQSDNPDVIGVSKVDDMYELLAGCDAFLTDYSSAAFDVAVMKIPVFLYCDDYKEYEKERGSLLWNMRELPFPMAENNNTLMKVIQGFDEDTYQTKLELLFQSTGMVEDGQASKKVTQFIDHN